MMTSEKVRVYVISAYGRNIYYFTDLVARCHNVAGVFAEILSHSLNGEVLAMPVLWRYQC